MTDLQRACDAAMAVPQFSYEFEWIGESGTPQTITFWHRADADRVERYMQAKGTPYRLTVNRQ